MAIADFTKLTDIHGKQRYWTVPFCEMSDRLLVANHKILHRLCSDLGKKSQDLVIRGEPLAVAVIQQHFFCIKEMGLRQTGYCDTAWTVPDWLLDRDRETGAVVPGQGQHPWPVNDGLVRRDRWDLAILWDGDFKGREMTEPEEWNTIIQRYKTYGCPHQAGDRGNICGRCGRYHKDASGVWVKI